MGELKGCDDILSGLSLFTIRKINDWEIGDLPLYHAFPNSLELRLF